MNARTRRAFVAAPLVFALAGVAMTAQRNPSSAPPAGEPAAQFTPVPDLPILGLAGVTFRSSNLEKARAYYQNVLGFAEAFTLKDAAGNVSSIFFKVNDDQYVEVIPGLKPGELRRIARVTVQSSDLQKLHQIYTERGANPSPIRTGPDGNPVFRVAAPSDHNIDFIQYVPGSQQTLARGKFLSPDRLSTHIWHVGLMTIDRAAVAPFYQGKLGLGRQLPGGRGESIDTPGGDSNTDSKYPLLDQNNPDQREQWIRENDGAANHMALEIADMRKARDLAQKRAGYTDLQVRAQVGGSRHWLVHLFDADGSRTELMETALQDPAVLPSRTIMAPGPPAPPILPKEGERGFPWPAPAPAQAPTPAPAPAPAQGRGGQTDPATPAGQGRGGGAAATPRYVPADPIDFNDHTGWTSMFDGKTLNGWDGPNLWRVEDGAIVVNSKAEPPTGSVYLLYSASQPKDFEFKWEVKLEGSGPNSTGPNSGVQFRATRLSVVPDRPNSKWETRGYQADFDNGFSNVGALIECCSGASRDGARPRPDRAQAGQIVRAAVADGQMPKTLATFGDSATVAKAYKPGEWNQMHLIARGRTMMFFINGQLMSVLIDDHPTKFLPQGFLSVQLEGRGDNKASFRNLWLKNLQ